jgi:hypothetical protein
VPLGAKRMELYMQLGAIVQVLLYGVNSLTHVLTTLLGRILRVVLVITALTNGHNI